MDRDKTVSGGSGSGFGNTEAGKAVQPCPAQKKHWVEIELIGEDGKPIPYMEYSVALPDGKLVRGFLDADGFTRLEQLDDGTCRVSFPELDREAWELVTTEGPKGSGT